MAPLRRSRSPGACGDLLWSPLVSSPLLPPPRRVLTRAWAPVETSHPAALTNRQGMSRCSETPSLLLRCCSHETQVEADEVVPTCGLTRSESYCIEYSGSLVRPWHGADAVPRSAQGSTQGRVWLFSKTLKSTA